jgi:hypothetical protein
MNTSLRLLSKMRYLVPVAILAAAFAAPAGGDDAVTVWSENAGVAATAACIAPLTTHSTNRVSTP